MPAQVVTTTDLPLPKFSVGKVRDTYDLGDRLLMVATDRISAFDSIMPNGVPDKGRVLTQLSAFWFDRLSNVIANHLISVDAADLPDAVRNDAALRDVLAGHFMIVKKAKRFDFECVVRGYLAGSGWADYQRTGAVCGVALPAGLRQGERLPEPIFTPATKAEQGHDINVSLDEMKRAIGEEMAQTIADVSIALYQAATTYALARGIIIADTKME
ncbi:MAG: phosphoribosylaminoimidazolesuccinocarboxamide synthase, partial [Ktedonobacterales bacterium]